MFDTYVTIVGNVLTTPEWRRTTQSQTLVANFKVASTARRLDRDSGRWVDGNSLRVRVNCWRKLAEGVAASVMVGDPVIVCGRLYTRDWTDDAGNHRTLYELEAVAVGHDLSRGRGRFLRNRPTTATSAVEDAEAEHRVHGEATEPVPAAESPALLDDRPLDDDFELPGLAARGVPAPLGFGPAEHPDRPADGPSDSIHGGTDPGADLSGYYPADVDPDGHGEPGPDPDVESRPERDESDPGDPGPGELSPPADGPELGGAASSPVSAGRGRRGRGRVPTPA
ncbi:single-stranded DNA-binding protein [Micromonospora sp. NPDC126480]|uniref:single-stranded DNA-binding protein n=1 Tax=Micromonospora sp. NPDC126480 TaxID=3155312 RepID=UPI00331A25FA